MPTAPWWPTRCRPTASCDGPGLRRTGAHGAAAARRARPPAAGDRRRRRPAAGRGVRAVRHRPRAVHRRAPGRLRRSSPATRRSASSRRSGPRPPARWGVAAGDRVAVEVFQSCRRVRAVRRRAVPALRAPRHRATCTASSPSTTAPGAVGRLRRAPVPRARLDAAAGARRARPGGRHAVQPARRRHPLGRHRARHRPPATSSPCSGPACAACRRAPRPRRPGAGFVMVTGAGPRDAERLALAATFGADLAVDVAADDPVARAAGRDRRRSPTSSSTSPPRRPPRSARRSPSPAPGGTDRRGRDPRRPRTRPASGPTSSSTRSCASSARSASTSPRTEPPSTCWPAGRYPFADLPRRCVDLDGAEDLVRAMAGPESTCARSPDTMTVGAVRGTPMSSADGWRRD